MLFTTAMTLCSLQCVASERPALPSTATMAEALTSTEASAEIPPQDRIYDTLIGSWNVRVFDVLPDGSRHESEGEWHVAYALEGRAVQDVWIVPTRKRRTASTPKAFNRYGTTVRSYEPASRTWRMVWINPVSGALQTLVGRATPDGIVHEGTDSGSQIRWSFRGLSDDSFHWTGERSSDGGKTWRLEAEFFGVR
jgi:uncharacterized protein